MKRIKIIVLVFVSMLFFGMFLGLLMSNSSSKDIDEAKIVTNSPKSSVDYSNEIKIVTRSQSGDVDLGLKDSKFEATKNPKGEGVIVYYPETRFSGVERKLLWLVYEGTAYPLNGASKNMTPTLSWLREAGQAVIDSTKLTPGMVDDEIMDILE